MKQPQRPSVGMVKQSSGAIDMDFDEQTGDEIVTRGMTAQTMRTRTVTAQRIAVPRDLDKYRAAVVREAALCGEDFEYRWTVNGKGGKQMVEGVSVDGALIMLRNFGNCALETEPVKELETPQHWVFRSTFIDWETGFTYERCFQQRKTPPLGMKDQDRALDMAYQIGQSKSQRNTIVKAMPVWLVRDATNAARESATAAIKDVPAKAKEAIASFEKKGVTREQLEIKVGAKVDQWNPRDILTLRAIAKAIKDRETTLENEFPPLETAPPPAIPAVNPTPPASAPADAPSAPASAPADPNAATTTVADFE